MPDNGNRNGAGRLFLVATLSGLIACVLTLGAKAMADRISMERENSMQTAQVDALRQDIADLRTSKADVAVVHAQLETVAARLEAINKNLDETKAQIAGLAQDIRRMRGR